MRGDIAIGRVIESPYQSSFYDFCGFESTTVLGTYATFEYLGIEISPKYSDSQVLVSLLFGTITTPFLDSARIAFSRFSSQSGM